MQLPRLVSDDEDNVDGSGSGDGMQLDKGKSEGGTYIFIRTYYVFWAFS